MIYGARPRRCAVACRRVGLGRKGIGLKVHINESVNKLRLQVTLFNDKQVRRFSFRFQSAGFLALSISVSSPFAVGSWTCAKQTRTQNTQLKCQATRLASYYSDKPRTVDFIDRVQ